jgi:hypothetical protein
MQHRRAQRLLQFRQALGDRRLGGVQLHGRGAEALELGAEEKGLQLLEGEVHSGSLYRKTMAPRKKGMAPLPISRLAIFPPETWPHRHTAFPMLHIAPRLQPHQTFAQLHGGPEGPRAARDRGATSSA